MAINMIGKKWDSGGNDYSFSYLILPPWASEVEAPYRRAEGKNKNGILTAYYYCPACEAWILGSRPMQFAEDTNDRGFGRTGTAWVCRRCGREIAFENKKVISYKTTNRK